jgi:hypothetical protein
MAQPKPATEKGGIEILEEAFHVLRAAPADLLPWHYLGSLPFVLGFLYFWAEMSTGAASGRNLAAGALGLAVLFGWMSYWQARFAARVEARLMGASPKAPSLAEALRLAAGQTLAAALGLALLPVAAACVLPLPFYIAFLQSLPACGAEGAYPLRACIREAAQQAGMFPRQNRRLLALLAGIWPFACVNTAAALVMVPALLKSLLGAESIFGLESIPVLNSTFLITVVALGHYVLLDPCIKTAYALRCHYGRARRTGADLRAELNRLRRWRRNAGAAGLLLAVLCLPAASDAQSLPAEELDRSIAEVLERPEFDWRAPQPDEPREGPQGLLADFFRWVDEMIEELRAKIRRAMDWLSRRFFPDRGPAGSGWWQEMPGELRFLFLTVVVLVAAVLLYVRSSRHLRRDAVSATAGLAAEIPAPDLNDEDLRADELPADGWLAMAAEMAGRGELRLAFRALFLGSLSVLAERELVTIRLSASNREYELELGRRAHDRRELLGAFAVSRLNFERVWYGRYGVDRESFESYHKLQEKIIALAAV